MIILVVKDNVITKYEENADTFNDNFHPISQFSSLCYVNDPLDDCD